MEDGASEEEKKWIMKAAKSSTSDSRGVSEWIQNAWIDFLDLLKVCDFAIILWHKVLTMELER